MNGLSRRLILVSLSTIVVFSGCAYAESRLLDFTDMFKGRVQWGFGVAVDAYATQFIAVGFEIITVPFPLADAKSNSNSIILRKRRIEMEESFCSLGWMVPPLCTMREINYYRGGKHHYEARSITIAEGVEIVSGNYIDTARRRQVTLENWNRNYDRGLLGVGFCVHAFIVGVSFEIALDELLDFILGWFLIDIMDDDVRIGWSRRRSWEVGE